MSGYDRIQQEKLEKLYEKEKIWYPEYVLHTFLMWLLIGISMIILLFPYQAYAHDRNVYPALFGIIQLGDSDLRRKIQLCAAKWCNASDR